MYNFTTRKYKGAASERRVNNMNRDAVNNLVNRNGTLYTDFYDPSGRRIRVSLKTREEKLALLRLKKMQTEAYEKGYFEMKRPVRMLFSELANKVLEYAKERNKRYKKVYVPAMKTLVGFFGKKFLHEVTPRLITQYQDQRKQEISAINANTAVKILRRAFNLAIQWGYVNFNPTKGIEFFREAKRKPRFLSIEEINRLLNYCNGYLKEMVLLALHTGMRKGEILGLNWNNADLRNRLIVLEKTKNNEIREIPMSNVVYDMLLVKYREKIRDSEEYVFTKKDGKPYSGIKSFGKVLEIAGIKKFRFHDLRHTYASQLVMADVDILTVKELMGHKDIKTTLIYAHLAPKRKREAIEKLEVHLKKTEKEEDIFGHKLDTNTILG